MPVVYLLFAVLFGYLGYSEAQKSAALRGRGPWGLPPWVWSLATGASLFLGGLLLIIAKRTTGPAAPPLGAPPAVSPVPATGPALARDILPGR